MHDVDGVMIPQVSGMIDYPENREKVLAENYFVRIAIGKYS